MPEEKQQKLEQKLEVGDEIDFTIACPVCEDELSIKDPGVDTEVEPGQFVVVERYCGSCGTELHTFYDYTRTEVAKLPAEDWKPEEEEEEEDDNSKKE